MTSSSLRIAFAGTPDFAAGHLSCLIEHNFNPVGVFTQPDRPSGRGKKTLPSPVKTVALNHDIPVFQPHSLDAEANAQLKALELDVLIVVAFGQILKHETLELPRFGCLNVHASLLPRWRGAAPIERAILAGDKETGICIMQMDSGLDTGNVLLGKSTPITDEDNADSISARLLELGCQGLIEVLGDVPGYQAKSLRQDDSLATYAKKLTRDEAQIHWSAPALTIQHQVQAFYPRSPAYFQFRDDQVRIIKARQSALQSEEPAGTVIALNKSAMTVTCGTGCLEISHLQLPGKKPAALADILNGHPDLFNTGMSLAAL